MNVLRLPFYLILTMLLTSCTSLPIGTSSTITDGHVAKCNEIANEVISLDKTFYKKEDQLKLLGYNLVVMWDDGVTYSYTHYQ